MVIYAVWIKSFRNYKIVFEVLLNLIRLFYVSSAEFDYVSCHAITDECRLDNLVITMTKNGFSWKFN